MFVKYIFLNAWPDVSRTAALKKNKVCIRAKTLMQQAKTIGMENYEICADYFLMSRGAGSDEINTYK